ncbi:MAG: PACE efflux transporter [Motiliproteus sp.]
MRSTLDRIRHTLLFEIIALIIATPIVYWITAKPLLSIGALALLLSGLAMTWNYLYNWGFDYWELRLEWQRPRKFTTRLWHALGFEVVLLLVGVFIIAYWLQMTLWAALLMDIGFALFFLVYALVYNWGYDQVFPIDSPELPVMVGNQ